MFRVALAGVRARRLRTLLTAAAMMLGVGLLGGSMLYGDTARTAFYDDLAREAAGVDLLATPVDTPRGTEADTIAAVARIPGVAHADTRPSARLAVIGQNGRVVTNSGELGLAVPVPTWPGFAPFRIVAGRSPAAPGEVALDAPTAARQHITTGSRLAVLDRSQVRRDLTVVGLADYGTSRTYADRSVVVLTRPDLASVATVDGYPQVVVSASGDSSPDALRAAVSAALGPAYRISTGDEVRRRVATDAAKYVQGFLTTLRISFLVALAVALLVVYNTFQILVAQRRREHALLRCVGAGRANLVRLVLAEAVLVGSLAGVGGALVAVVAGYALPVAQDLFGRGVPDYHVAISWPALVIPFVVAILATMASALPAALVAGRVPPLAALRSAADPQPAAGRTGLRRALTVVAAGIVAVAGVLALNHGRGRGFDGLPTIVGGAMVSLAAVVLVLPLVITGLSAPLRWILGRLFGATGRLAVANAGRHPVRSAASAIAVLAGIAPVTAFAILLATAQAQGASELAENFPVDYVVSHPQPVAAGAQPAFAARVVAGLRSSPEFRIVADAKVADTFLDGRAAPIAAVGPGVLGSGLAVEVRAGEVGSLPAGTVAVSTDFADQYRIGVDDTVRVGPVGHTVTARVVALVDGLPLPAAALVNWSDFASAGLAGADYLLIRRSDATSAAAAGAALDRELTADPLAVVASTAERRESVADSFGRRLAQFEALLAVSLVIAVLGLANALFLAVLERTRETGILRAAGLGRRQLYGMVLIEAVLTAFVGAVTGVLFGTGLGWVTARELVRFYGHGSPVIPVQTLLAYVGAALVGGAIASLLPARRAARSSIVAAIESV